MLAFQQLSLASTNARTEVQQPGIDRVYKYLSDRGLSKEDVDALKLHILPANHLVNLLRSSQSSTDERIAVVFPHFDASGQIIPWWSARLVDAGIRLVTHTFSEYLDRSQRGKMLCPAGEPIHAYLPPILDWRKLERGQRIYFHESVVKAVNGAKLGYHSIGLNGVRGYSSKKHGIRLLEEIRDLPWKGLNLQPVVVFDSNAVDNWDVQQAIAKLAQILHEITGQRARHLLLPKNGEEHWGFDDYVVSQGATTARKFLDGEGEEIPVSQLEVLKLQLNSEVCVVRSLGRIAEQETGTLMSRGVFTDVNFAHYTVLTDEDTPRQVNVPRLWLQDERRSEVSSIAYLPGKDRVYAGQLNLWRGMGLDPSSGDISPWLSLLENCVVDESLRAWIIQWFAFPLQKLGEKLNTFLHIFGPSGVGKNLLLRPFLRIYGHNAVTIGREHITSDFTSLYAAKQFLNIDEIHSGRATDGLTIYNKIKKIVTGEEIVVNMKGQPEYVIRNCINLVTTSNYFDSIKIEGDDRRAAVIKFDPQVDHRGDEKYWQSYVDWCDEGGASALYSWLLCRSLVGFDPKGWAPHTEYKDDVVDASRSPMERWVKDLWDEPEHILPAPSIGRSLFTAKELSVLYYGVGSDDLKKGQVDALANQLRNQGFKRANDGKGVKTPDGRVDRYWVIRDRKGEWKDGWDCGEHLRKFYR